ncbi:hypothetical protein B0H17DRAFT_1129753 [Mycena rosella]|uniref:Uncharacterized protein n=1 Tax=Mycena rosella TaxID=1033263 RepID=A0AAD7DTP0_MYCRO|nr:hypothetical protein B0H17DRAFT_1129753 [Mycena rosella]
MFSERVPSGVRAIEPCTRRAPAFALMMTTQQASTSTAARARSVPQVRRKRPACVSPLPDPLCSEHMPTANPVNEEIRWSRPVFCSSAERHVRTFRCCLRRFGASCKRLRFIVSHHQRRGLSRLCISSPLAMTPNGIFGVGCLNDFLVEASFQASVQCTRSVLSIRARLVCPSVSQSSKYQEVEVAATGRHRDPAASQQPELTSRKQVQATTSYACVRSWNAKQSSRFPHTDLWAFSCTARLANLPFCQTPRLPLESAPKWPLHQTPAFVRNLHRAKPEVQGDHADAVRTPTLRPAASVPSFLNLDVAAQSGEPAPFPARYTDPASIRCALSMRGCEYPRLRSAARVRGQPRHDWHSSWGGDGDSGARLLHCPAETLRAGADRELVRVGRGCRGGLTRMRPRWRDVKLLVTSSYRLLCECYKLLQAAMWLLPHATRFLRECYKLLRLSTGCYELLRQSYELLRAATSSYGTLQPLRHSYEPLPCFYWVLWQLYELLHCNPNPTTRCYTLLRECYAVATRLLCECYAAATRLLWSAPEIGTLATTLRALRGPTGAPERAQGLLM